jgi:hypothetical protein
MLWKSVQRYSNLFYTYRRADETNLIGAQQGCERAWENTNFCLLFPNADLIENT